MTYSIFDTTGNLVEAFTDYGRIPQPRR